MSQKLHLIRLLWAVTACLAVTAALIGVMNQNVYSNVAGPEIDSGIFSQDLMTIGLSILLLFWAIRLNNLHSIQHVLGIGVLGYLWYGYGIYVIERLYTPLYLLYMAIFGLAFYAIVYSVATLDREHLQRVRVPKPVRVAAVGFALFIPALFYPLWISRLLPLMHTGQKPEFLYAIYILDCCFELPAFLIIAVMAARKQGFGMFLLPVVLVKGFTILTPVALSGLLAPLYNQPLKPGEIGLYSVLACVFLGMTILYCRAMKVPGDTSNDKNEM